MEIATKKKVRVYLLLKDKKKTTTENKQTKPFLLLKNKKMDNKKELNLIGTEGNVFNILAKARRVALKNNMDWDKIKAEAKSGDYENLINVMTKYFKVK